MTNSIVLGRAAPRAVLNSYPLSSSYHHRIMKKRGKRGPLEERQCGEQERIWKRYCKVTVALASHDRHIW